MEVLQIIIPGTPEIKVWMTKAEYILMQEIKKQFDKKLQEELCKSYNSEQIKLIDTVVPKTEHERIAVIGQGSHFEYFVKLLFKRTGIDFRKNFVHCQYPEKLREVEWSKIIVLNY